MKLPFFNELESAQTVLLAGAGGGFDVFTGLPLYGELSLAIEKFRAMQAKTRTWSDIPG